MRIAFVVTEFPALSETFILNRITGLIDRGHDVDIFAQYVRKYDPSVHPDVEKYGLMRHARYLPPVTERLRARTKLAETLVRRGLNWSDLRHLLVRKGSSVTDLYLLSAAIIEHGPYDIVHCCFGPNGLRAIMLKELGFRGKITVSFHGYDLSQTLKKLGNHCYSELFEKADMMLPVCDLYLRRLVDLGCPREKVKTHYSGVDLTCFTFHPKPISTDSPLLLSIGRLCEKKGLEFGIRAVAELRQKYPGLRYRILGEGPLREELQQLVADLNLTNVVEMPGALPQSDIVCAVEESSLLLVPHVLARDGDEDTLPNSIKEAMAVGRPIVATVHGGVKEMLEHDQSAYLVPQRDPQALARGIMHMLDNPDHANACVQKAREVVCERFDILRLSADLEAIYQQL